MSHADSTSPNLFAALNHDWAILATSSRARRQYAEWARRDPRLAAAGSLSAVVRRCRAEEPDAHELLSALVATGSELGSRAVLEAMLPLVVSVAHAAARDSAIGPDRAWPSVEDLTAELTAHAWTWLCEHAGRDIDWIGPDLRRCLWRHYRRTTHAATSAVPVTTQSVDHADGHSVRDRSVQAATAAIIVDAYRSGTISLAPAQVLYALSVHGDSVASIADRQGIDRVLFRKRKSRAAADLARHLDVA